MSRWLISGKKDQRKAFVKVTHKTLLSGTKADNRERYYRDYITRNTNTENDNMLRFPHGP